MQHTKLTTRIPFPLMLNIEDNQIYHGPPKKQDIEEEKNNEFKEGVDAFDDLSIINNHLMSESHFGTLKLQEIMKNDEENDKAPAMSFKMDNLG